MSVKCRCGYYMPGPLHRRDCLHYAEFLNRLKCMVEKPVIPTCCTRYDVDLVLPGHRMATVVRLELDTPTTRDPNKIKVIGLGYRLGNDPETLKPLGVEWLPLGLASQEAEDHAKSFLVERLLLQDQATELFAKKETK